MRHLKELSFSDAVVDVGLVVEEGLVVADEVGAEVEAEVDFDGRIVDHIVDHVVAAIEV